MKGKDLERALKADKILELALKGMSNREIAKHEEVQLSDVRVGQILNKELQRIHDGQSAQKYRVMFTEKYLALMNAWEKPAATTYTAAMVYLKYSEALGKLWGVNAATSMNVTVDSRIRIAGLLGFLPANDNEYQDAIEGEYDER